MSKIRECIADYLKPWGGHHGIIAATAFLIATAFGFPPWGAWGLAVGAYAGKEWSERLARTPRRLELWDLVTPALVVSLLLAINLARSLL